MAERKGLFIVFEGTDGTGKSTQLSLLADYLKERDIPVVTTKEPTEGPYGQKIRQLYQDRNSATPEEELQLFLADRQEHVDTLITPALDAGKVVLSDRYYLSTVAYQGAIGFDVKNLLERNSFAPPPDLALVFHAPIETGQQRITAGRGENLNDFEQWEYLSRVAEIFASLELGFITRINASGSVADIHNQVLAHVLPLIPAHLLPKG